MLKERGERRHEAADGEHSGPASATTGWGSVGSRSRRTSSAPQA